MGVCLEKGYLVLILRKSLYGLPAWSEHPKDAHYSYFGIVGRLQECVYHYFSFLQKDIIQLGALLSFEWSSSHVKICVTYFNSWLVFHCIVRCTVDFFFLINRFINIYLMYAWGIGKMSNSWFFFLLIELLHVLVPPPFPSPLYIFTNLFSWDMFLLVEFASQV